MILDFAIGSLFWETILTLGVLGGTVAIAWIANRALTIVLNRFAAKTTTQLDDFIIKALRGPFVFFLLAQGAFLAVSNLSFLNGVQTYINQAWFATVLALVFLGIQRTAVAILHWYEEAVSLRKGGQIDSKLLPLLRHFINVSLLIVGVLLVLDNLGIKITPLMAGLGIGGLAVALALQPTLSNFFAGTYLLSGNVLKAGDFIEMEGGTRGYVMDVGWRSTRIRTPFNNLVVIPNARLADSILTNYFGPSMEMGIIVEGGVSYSSDLAYVREVALEVASQLIEEMPEAAKSQPWFGYERFGESNVDFWVWLQAKDRISSFALKTELMIRLHERFAKEGIEINYPVRKLLFLTPDGAQELLSSGESAQEHQGGVGAK